MSRFRSKARRFAKLLNQSGGLTSDNMEVTGNLQVDGTVDGVDVSALKASHDTTSTTLTSVQSTLTTTQSDLSTVQSDLASHTHAYSELTGTPSVSQIAIGGWTVTESSGVLYFATGGANKFKIDASGNLTVTGNVTAYGSV